MINIMAIENACRMAEIAGTGVTLTAEELRWLLNRCNASLTITRPICPDCDYPLTGWIEHTLTRCPSCGKSVTVKWRGAELVVQDE